MDDIVPGLLEDMTNDFQSQYDSSSKIKSLKEKLDKGEATYKEANEYAAEVGGITKNVYSEHLTSDNLPDGKCYYNIAERVTSQTLHDQYELVADYSEKVQTDLNKMAGIGLKAQRADENTEEYHSLANYMSSAENYDDVAKSTAQSAERMARETVDKSVKKNAEFQNKAGLKPKIVRNGGNDCCSWCAEVTGTYDYPNVPKDIYKRHNNCTCTVEYDPGSGKRQDVWSKKWMSAEEVEQRENLKTLGLDDSDKYSKIEYRKHISSPKEIDAQKIRMRLSDNEGAFHTVDERRNEDKKGIIKPRNIIKDLETTEIGKEAISLIEKNNIFVELCYGRDNVDYYGKKMLGCYNPIENKITVFVDETKTIKETAKTVIHEAFHTSDYGMCQRSEVYCIAKEKQHEKGGNPLTEEEIKDIIRLVRRLYPHLPWEV